MSMTNTSQDWDPAAITFYAIAGLVVVGIICVVLSFLLTIKHEKGLGEENWQAWKAAQRAELSGQPVIISFLKALQALIITTLIAVCLAKGLRGAFDYLIFASPAFGAVMVGLGNEAKAKAQPLVDADFRHYFWSTMTILVGYAAYILAAQSDFLSMYALWAVALCCMVPLVIRRPWGTPKKSISNALAYAGVGLNGVAFFWVTYELITLLIAHATGHSGQ
jgi:hypothetical protein